jgi:CheY-like chemotaxis protein
MKSQKIMLIDDDKDVLDAMSMVLEDNGYEVSSVYKTDLVYNKVLSLKPNLIILDLVLSGRDGKEICRNFKSNELTKSIPIVLSSAHPSADKAAQEAGADGFLPKPFDSEDLIKIVKKYITK